MKGSKTSTWHQTNSHLFPKRREKAVINEQILTGKPPITKVAIGEGSYMAKRIPLSDAFSWNSEDY